MNRPDEQRRQQGAIARRSGTRALSTMTAGLAIAGALGVGAVAYSANQSVLAKIAAQTATSTSTTGTAAGTNSNASTTTSGTSTNNVSSTSGLSASTTAPAAATTTTTPVAATHGS